MCLCKYLHIIENDHNLKECNCVLKMDGLYDGITSNFCKIKNIVALFGSSQVLMDFVFKKNI